ncbi:MAG TPA: CHAT domain-containing protein [Pyrinomonadaceae bacterium]|nr:CHAT domain-containing protein [Pyrinomonadaceae bacterium]
METEPADNTAIKSLNALIAMAQWDKHLPFYFARLYKNENEYEKALQRIRKASDEAAKSEPPCDTLDEQEWKTLYVKTTTTSSLSKLFANDGDPFRNASRAQILLLAEISDLKTDPQKMFSSKNGAFHLVLDAIRKKPEPTTKNLLTQCIHRFYNLFATDRSITERIYKLAGSADWYPVMASLKDGNDYTIDESTSTYDTLQTWNTDLTRELRPLVLSLFHVPRNLVTLVWEQQGIFGKALQQIREHQPLADEVDLKPQVANVAYDLLDAEAKDQLEAIKSDLILLASIARHYFHMRKFVKLDGLVYSWPRIAALARANYTGLVYVEELILKRKQKPDDAELDSKDARELYALCANNKTVVSFLKLQPYFNEIPEDELRRYRPLARPASPDTPASSDSPASSHNINATSSPLGSGIVNRVNIRPGTPYIACELVITTIPLPVPASGPEQEYEFDISINSPLVEVPPGRVRFSIKKLVERVLGAVGVTGEDSLQFTLKNVFSGTNAEEILLRGGRELFNALIAHAGLEQQLAGILSGQPGQPALPDRLVRLIVIIESIREDLHFLPWEWFPSPGSNELLLSDERFSLVRCKRVLSEVSRQSLLSPVTIMGLFPNVPIGARDVSEGSIKALEALRNAGTHCVLLKRDEATLKSVTAALDKFRPQILHFEGWVESSPGEGSGLRIFFSEGDNVAPLGLPEFEKLLKLNNVQLLVIGRNESNRVYGNPGTMLAGRIVRMAVPSVLAPVRAVDEDTATAFITEFYHAFLSGYTLEQAVFIARKMVASRRGDWTAFALFSDPWVLDDFRLLLPTA